jgi:glutathione S-transferase|eukprot:Transcript_5607.p1 GENE.Transcript_5607~~Transcript_5607.p1  ORF type:complete len:273 (+),score=53.95 Transcript_5607:77-895(+)
MKDVEPLIIYTFAGSQFSAKVLTALDAHGIQHYVTFVSLLPSKRVLPSGGTLVPELVVGQGPGRVVVTDSEAILRWLDDNRGTKLFPTEQAAELSGRASNGVLAGAAIYYNWVHTPTYRTTMRAKAVSKGGLPGWICLFRGQLVDRLTSKQRATFWRLASKQLGGLSATEMEDEPAVRRRLIDELLYLQSQLQDDSQSYLLPGCDAPTAADCAVFGQLERIVGDMGDADIPPSLPELLQDPQLARLWAWRARMRERCPMRFKGKRPPPEVVL